MWRHQIALVLIQQFSVMIFRLNSYVYAVILEDVCFCDLQN